MSYIVVFVEVNVWCNN